MIHKIKMTLDNLLKIYSGCCCHPITQPFPNICDSMVCSKPDFPVLHYLTGHAQAHVHWVTDAIQPSCTSYSLLLLLQSFPATGSFLMNLHFASAGESIGASTSASVLPTNIQVWVPLGFIGLISSQSKELSRISSNMSAQKYQFSPFSLLYSPSLTCTHNYWKSHSFD